MLSQGVFVLVILVAITAAVPFADDWQNDGATTISQCSLTCPESTTKFSYRPGKTYEYVYESDIKTSVAGTSSEHSSLHMRATVQIDVISTCEMTLRLTGVSLHDSDPTRYDNRQQVRDINQFRRALEEKALSFSFVDGQIQSICPRTDDEPWAVNIRRGILSALQNSMSSLQGLVNTRETDVSGDCPVKYEVVSSGTWSHVIKIKKTKDLLGCMNRHQAQSVFQGTPYNSASPVQSSPLMKSSSVCEQEINTRSRVLTKSSCVETHAFRPFAKSDNGALTHVTYKLTFRRESDSAQRADSSAKRRSNLLFDHTLTDVQLAESIFDAQQTITQLCRQIQDDVRPQTPGVFSDLIRQLKRLDSRSLRQLHTVTKSSLCTKAEQILRDALPVVGTTSSVVLMRDLINAGQTTPTETDVWLTSIAFIKNPTKDMMNELKPLLSSKFVEASLAISSIVNTYCHQFDSQQSSEEVEQIVKLFEDKLNYNCRSETDEQMTQILSALRAVGNAGIAAASVTDTLNRCATNDGNAMAVRVAAVNAFRRIECTATNRETLLRLVEDKVIDAELRINAYLAVMQCVTEETLTRIQTILESEEINQVGSFIWTHLTNLQETVNPLKDKIREIVENTELTKQFDIDKRKFSRNIELSTFFEMLNMGGSVESNLIWSSESFVPRSAMVNLTVDMFGQSVNLLEIGGRVQGIEDLLESLFGRDSKDNRQKRAAVRDDVLNTIDRKFAKSMDRDQLSYYVRMFGNDIHAGDVYQFDISAIKSRLNFLDWLIELAKEHTIDVTRNFHFLDASLTVPTGTGLPVRLTTEGTATVSLTAKGKVDIRQMFTSPSTFDISGSVKPSAAVEVRAQMGVDATVARTGLKLINTLHTSTILDGAIQLKDGKIFNFDFNLPQDKMEIFSAESHLYVVYRNEDREQKSPSSKVWQWQQCSSQTVTERTGLELCADLSVPSTVLTTGGPAALHVYLNKRDTYRGLHFDASYVHSKELGTETVRVSFNTPGSRIDRELTTEFQLDRNQRQVRLDVKTPWKKINVEGGIVNRPELKQASIKALLDDTVEYSINAEIQVDERSRQETRFTPKLVIVSPNRANILFDGTVTYIKGSKAEVKLALKNVARDPVTVEGSVQVQERRTAVKYDTSLQIASPIFKGSFNGYTSNVRDQQTKSWASRAELIYQYRGGRKERILVNHKLRDQSTSNLKTYSMDGSWTSTVWPRYNGQAGVELSYSPNSLRTKFEAGLDDVRKLTIITSGAYDMSSRDKKINGLVKMMLPYKDWNYEVKLDHVNNWESLQSNATVNYGTMQQPAVINIDIGAKKDRSRPLSLMGEARLKYPGREMSLTETLTERAPHEYYNVLNVQMQPGSKASIVSTYKMSPRHEVANTITINNMQPIQLNGHLNPSLKNMQARIDLNYNAKTYLFDASWSHRGTTSAFNTRANAEVALGGHTAGLSTEFSRREQEWNANIEAKLNQDKRIALSTQITAALMTPKIQAKLEWPNNFVSVTGSGKYEHRGWYSVRNDVEGNLKLTSSLDALQDIGASFMYDQSTASFKTNGEVWWTSSSKISADLTVDRSKATLSVMTPFPGYRSTRLESTYTLNGRSGTLDGKVEWDGRRMTLRATGDANQPSKSIQASLQFTSPFNNFEQISSNLVYTANGPVHDSRFDVTWARDRQVSVVANMNHQYSGSGVASRGELTVSTPFTGFRSNRLSWNHEHSASTWKCHHELDVTSRKFVIDVDASHRLTRAVRKVSLKSSFNCPPVVDWMQNMSINVDYQHDIRAWRSVSKSDIQWGRNAFSYEHDVNIEPSAAVIVKTKLTTPFRGLEQIGIGLNNRRNGNSWTANNELMLGRLGKTTLDGSFSYNGYIVDGMVRMTTPISQLERISASIHSSRQDDGVWSASTEFQYADDKTVSLSGKLGWDSRKIVQIEARTPCRYVRQMKFVAGFNGTWQNFEASSELQHNMLGRDKILAMLSSNTRNPAAMSGQFVIQTPFAQLSTLKVQLQHLQDSRSHTVTRATWEFNNYRGSTVHDLNVNSWSDFNGRHELEYLNNRKIELTTSFKVSPKVVVAASFKSPFENARTLSLSLNQEGTWNEFKVSSEIVHNLVKKITTNVEFAIKEDSLKTFFRLTTPFKAVDRVAFNINLSGRPTQFNLDSSFEVNRQKLTKMMDFQLNRQTLRLTGRLETPFTQLRTATYIVNHNGNWRNFNNNFELTFDGQQITGGSEFRFDGPSGKLELRTPYSTLSSLVVNFDHVTKPGRTFAGWSNSASIEINDRRYSAESDYGWKGKELKSKVVVNIPDEYSVRLTHRGESNSDFTSSVVIKLANDRITNTLTYKFLPNSIDARLNIETTFDGYERFEVSFKHDGSVSDFRTSASLSTPFRRFRQFSAELTYRGNPNEFVSQLKVDLPFAALQRLAININHRGDPSDFNSALTVTYDDKSISAGLNFKNNMRTTEATISLQTPYSKYSKFRGMFSFTGQPTDMTLSTTIELPFKGYERFYAELTHNGDWKTFQTSGKVETTVDAIQTVSYRVEHSREGSTQIRTSAQLTIPAGTFSALVTHNGDSSNFQTNVDVKTPFRGVTTFIANIKHQGGWINPKTSITLQTAIRGYENFGLTFSKSGDLRNFQMAAELTTPIQRLEKTAISWSHNIDSSNVNIKTSVESSYPGYERFSLEVNHVSSRRNIKTSSVVETSMAGFTKFGVSSDYSSVRKGWKWSGLVETPIQAFNRWSVGLEHAESDSNDGFRSSVRVATPLRGYESFDAILTHSGDVSQFQTSLRLNTPLRMTPQIDILLKHRATTATDFQSSLTVEYAGKKIETEIAIKVAAVSRHEFNYDASFKMATPCPYFQDFAVSASHNRKPDVKTGALSVVHNTEKKVDLDYSYTTSGDRNININVRSPYAVSTELNMGGSGQGSAILNWDTSNNDRQIRFDFGLKNIETRSLTERSVNFKTNVARRIIGFDVGYKLSDDKFSSNGQLHWDRDTEPDFAYNIEAMRTSRRGLITYNGQLKLASQLFNTDSSVSHSISGGRSYITEIVLDSVEKLTIKSDLNIASPTSFIHALTIQHPRLTRDVSVSTEARSDGIKCTLLYERQTWVVEGTMINESRQSNIKYSSSLRLSSASNLIDIQLAGDVASNDEAVSGGIALKHLMSRDRQMKTFALRSEINKLRKELKLELETPVDTLRLSSRNRELNVDTGIVRYDASLECKYFNVRSSVDFSLVDRSIDVKLYKAQDYAQLFGQIVSPMQMTFELSHSKSNGRMNDAQLALSFSEDDRLLTGRAFCRPDLIADLKSIMRSENFALPQLSVDVEQLQSSLYEDMRYKNNYLRQSVITPLSNVASYLSDHVQNKVNQITTAFNVMYRANEFYIRDIHQALKRHYDDLSRRAYYKMADLRRSYQKWSDEMQQKMRVISGAWHNFQYKMTQFIDSNRQRIEMSLAHWKPDIDAFIETVKRKLIDICDRIRNSDKLRELMNKIYTMNPSDYFLPPSQWKDKLMSYADRVDNWIQEVTEQHEVRYARDWTLNAIQKNKWLYELLGVEQHVNEWIAEMRTMTWDTLKSKVHQFVSSYLQLDKTRFTVWNPRTGEYSFQMFIPFDIPDMSFIQRYDPRPFINQATEWIMRQLPDEDLSLIDTIYMYKPPSDIRDWVPPFKSHATLTGSQHYMTFDRRFFEFAGECSYLLARDFIGGTFSVMVNYDRPVGGQPVKKSIMVITGGRQVEVFPDAKVTVDGSRVEMPVRVANATVLRSGNLIQVVDDWRGLDVTCDLPHDHCTVAISGWYYGKTAGLFGTYDNEPANDMMTIDKSLSTQPETVAESWTVGQRCRSTNRAVSVSADTESRQYKLCSELFTEKTSIMRTCFRIVDPASFMRMCLNDVTTGDDICRPAAAYVHECRHYDVHLRMPKQCVHCEVPLTGKMFYEMETIKLEQPSEIPRAADIVFVIQHAPCNKDVLAKLNGLVDNLDKAMQSSGVSSTRYAVVGFGGKKLHLTAAHVHTMDGQLFNSASKVSQAIDKFDLEAGTSSDPLLAVMFAAQLSFRAGASKTIVLVSCESCREADTSYTDVQRTLLGTDIHLHVLIQDIIQLKSKSPKTAYIYGVDEQTVYTRKDVAGDELAGEPDLRRYIRLPKDLCVALTQDTDGSVFSARQWLDSRPLIQKQFVDVMVRTMARKAQPTECQLCQCSADDAQVGTSQCRSCQPRDPISWLLRDIDSEDEPVAVQDNTDNKSKTLTPSYDVTRRPANVSSRRSVRPSRRPRVTRKPVVVRDRQAQQ